MGFNCFKTRNHFEEIVYFLPLRSQKFLALILSTSEGWKAESTLEPRSSFEDETPLDWESSALTTKPIMSRITNYVKIAIFQFFWKGEQGTI